MAGTGSTTSSLTCLRLVVEADFLSCLPGGGKNPERWLGFGDVGDPATDEASVRVVDRELCEEARERPDMLLSESSADELVDEGTSFCKLLMFGAL